MAKTLSQQIPLGTKAASFSLNDYDGKSFSLDSFEGADGYLIMFICNHCPYVIHVQTTIKSVAEYAQDKNIAVFAINSNDTKAYPEDAPDKMRSFAQQNGFTFPYLFDETQDTAKKYSAACTPDFFLYDKNLALFYHGQIDSSRPGNQISSNGQDLINALDLCFEGSLPPKDQVASMGCNIKWKIGHN